MKIKKHNKRELTFNTYNAEQRIIAFSAASAEPVDRGEYIEVLDMSRIDISRVEKGVCPFLMDHDWSKQVGRILTASVNNDRLEVTAKITRNECGEELLNDLIDDIRNGISIGYNLTEITSKAFDAESNKPILTFAFSVYEISSVSVPADANVGVGRAYELDRDTHDFILWYDDEEKKDENVDSNTVVNQEKTEEKEVVDVVEVVKEVVETQPEAVVQVDDVRKLNNVEKIIYNEITEKRNNMLTKEIMELFAIHGKRAMEAVAKLQAENVEITAETVENAIRAMKPVSVQTGLEGSVQQELQNVNIGRLLTARSLNVAIDGLEGEILRSAKFKMGAHGGVILPAELQRAKLAQYLQKRAVNLTSASATFNHETLSTLDLLKAESVFGRGANYIQANANGMGSIVIPRVATASNIGFVGESVSPAEMAITFGSVEARPKTLATKVSVSRLAEASNPGLMDTVSNTVLEHMVRSFDRAAFTAGSALTNNLVDHSGLISTSATGDVSYEDIVDFVSAYQSNFGSLEGAIFAGNHALLGKLKTTPKAAGQGGFIYDGSGIDGTKFVGSHQIATAANKTNLYLLNPAAVTVAQWNDIEYRVVDIASNGDKEVQAFWDIDLVVSQPEYTAVLKGLNV